MITKQPWAAATTAYAVLIFVVSVIPVSPRLAPGHLDKVAHLCEYLLLAWLLVQVLTLESRSRRFWTAWWWATSYGALIELIQVLVPWRCAEWLDALANALGASLGILAASRYSPAKRQANSE